MPSDIESILGKIPELAGPATVTPLSGGITNHNFRVETGGATYVLRIAGQNTAQLGIDRDREHACAVAAAAAGVGAEVVAYLPEHCALLTRFLAGQVLSVDSARRDDVLQRAVAAIARLHAAPPVPGEFSAFLTIDDYHNLAIARAVSLPPEVPQAIAELKMLEKRVATSSAACPCHNDLLPGNLIDDGTTIRIIDWEYAGMGDRFFDLGNFAENHRLDASQEQQLLRLYFGREQPTELARLRAMRRVSALREAMWGFAQAGISQLDFDFTSYAREHLGRFFLQAQD
ncbi:MAG TPA: phosphotransferase [Pirellulales bacterium]